MDRCIESFPLRGRLVEPTGRFALRMRNAHHRTTISLCHPPIRYVGQSSRPKTRAQLVRNSWWKLSECIADSKTNPIAPLTNNGVVCIGATRAADAQRICTVDGNPVNGSQ